LKTKKGPWYTAYSSLTDCRGDASELSEFTCTYYNDGSMDYFSYTWMEAMHALPFPVNKSSVNSWRLLVNGKSTYPSDFALFMCTDYSCSSYGDEQYFQGSSGARYIWTSFWTKRGISDGSADWAIDSDAYFGDLTVYRYQIEVKYWKLE